MRTTTLAVLAGTSITAIMATTPTYGQDAQLPPKPAAAAPKPAAAVPTEEKEDEIIITGTQIRGTTPAGQTLLTTTEAQVEEQGAANANEILAQIPQAANVFQNLPSVGGGGSVGGTIAASRLSFSSISLRNLPNVNTGAGEFTLQLIDSHRIVPIGSDVLGGVGTDPSSIPSSLIQRVEIMPDGGSAIYGSNAVAGVINYLTKDKFDGVELQARGGFAKDYWQYDASLTAGTSWSTGSIFGNVTYSSHDALFGVDRGYIHAWDANPNSPLYKTPIGLNCDSPNIAITSDIDPSTGVLNARRLYPMTAINGTIQPFTTNGGTNGNGVSTTNPNGIAGGNRCDSTDFTAIYPKSHAWNAALGLTQEITDTLRFGLKGLYSKRETTSYQALDFGQGVAVTSTNPNYRPVCNAPVTPPAIQPAGPICGVTAGFFTGDQNRNQTVFGNYSSVLPRNTNAFIDVEWWQVTPSLTWDFAKDWQARALVSYGESKDSGVTGGVDATLRNARILCANPATTACINPYNLPGSAPGAFDGLIKYDYRAGEFHMLDTRVIADGPLPFIRAPGGEIRVAIGAEYAKTRARVIQTGTILSPTPDDFLLPVNLTDVQTVKSVFGEMQIPLISEENNVPLIHSLFVSGSIRYDKYNDSGSTTNYLVGVTWEPVEAVKLRGSWSTSFAAPNLLTQIAIRQGAVFANPTTNQGNTPLPYFAGFIPPGGANAGQPGAPPQGVVNQINPIGIGPSLSSGTVPGIGPQTSETWSLGFEISPLQAPGLTLAASYYKLDISDAISSPFQPGPQSLFDFHPELVSCHNPAGGPLILGTAANAPAACTVPLSLAELAANGYTVPASAGGLSTDGSLSAASPASAGSAAFGTIPWPTIMANYCGPPGAPGPAGTFGVNCAPLPGQTNTYTVFYVLDNRSRNLGFIFSRGIDFRASYRTNVPWGSLDAMVSGTINLSTKSQAQKGGTVVNNQATGFSPWRLSANLGTNIDNFRAQITWQHSDGFKIAANAIGTEGTAVVPGTVNFGQTHVKPYDTFDLFFRYDFDSWGTKNGLFKDLSVTLNINNFLNLTPPRQGGGYANGTTLGRLFQLGITKNFK